MSSFLSAVENTEWQRQNVRCDFKHKREESTRAVEHKGVGSPSLFISCLKYNFIP